MVVLFIRSALFGLSPEKSVGHQLKNKNTGILRKIPQAIPPAIPRMIPRAIPRVILQAILLAILQANLRAIF